MKGNVRWGARALRSSIKSLSLSSSSPKTELSLRHRVIEKIQVDIIAIYTATVHVQAIISWSQKQVVLAMTLPIESVKEANEAEKDLAEARKERLSRKKQGNSSSRCRSKILFVFEERNYFCIVVALAALRLGSPYMGAMRDSLPSIPE